MAVLRVGVELTDTIESPLDAFPCLPVATTIVVITQAPSANKARIASLTSRDVFAAVGTTI